MIRPRPELEAGTTHRVTVVYGGVPGQPVDSAGALYGFVSIPDGALVADEPEGASTWYPVDDVPTDEATYDFRITVPEGRTAVALAEEVSGQDLDALLHRLDRHAGQAGDLVSRCRGSARPPGGCAARRSGSRAGG